MHAMKVYLDDERPTPDGWVRCYWPDQVIQLLETGRVKVLSLDHDLGDDSRGTGYDVLTWIEAKLFNEQNFDPPEFIFVHSANSSAREKMLSAIGAIRRLNNIRQRDIEKLIESFKP